MVDGVPAEDGKVNGEEGEATDEGDMAILFHPFFNHAGMVFLLFPFCVVVNSN